MTTNNPPIAAWAPSTALHKLESRHNNAPCILTDRPAEFNDVALVRLADYEALKAAHEEELFQVRQDRDAHFGELMRALEQVDAMKAEREKLRKDAERYRWLRDKCDRWDGGLVVAKVTEFSLSSWSGDDLNAAIDAAMEKEDKP